MFKKIYTKLTALLLIVNLMLIGPAGLVIAQEATAENNTTGSTSDNTAATDTTQTTNTTNDNTATVDNTTTGGTDTGTNTTSNNTGDGTITTSDGSTTASTSTTVNTNGTTPSPSPSNTPMPWTTWTGDGDWQDNYATNTKTGSSSTNTATTDTTQTDNLVNNNTATINNDADIGSSTGTNTASDNTGDAAITTGNASLTSNTQNVANLNFWTGEGDWTNLWNGEALNYLTGKNSDNEAAASVTQLLTVLNDNGIDISNILAAHAASGSNIASDNTGNATIATGNASLLSTLFNLANTNIFGAGSVDILYQDIYGSYSGNIDLTSATPYSLLGLSQNPLTLSSSNNKTGSGSDNLANVNGSLTFDILNNNDGNLINDWDLSAITGENTASDNTGNATIETGDAEIIGNLINMLNTNIFTNQFYFGVINVYGNWLGNLLLPEYPTGSSYTGSVDASAGNSMTGFNSDNSADVNLSKDLTTTNNNTGTITGDYNLVVDTGSNSASDNTMGGSVTSGDSWGEANLANWVNTNIVSDSPWWLIMVNNLGTWIPILQNPATGTQIVLDIDSLGLGNQGSSGEVDASANNQMTGSNSNNSASVDSSVDGTVTNNNTGTITNNIDALALTGGNSADRNTGAGMVTTGDASIWLNVLNFLNTNISAPSVMLTIINVFGSWTGDVLNYGSTASIPSGATQQTADTTNTSQGGCGACLASNSVPSGNNNNNSSSNNSNTTSNSGSSVSSSNPLAPLVTFVTSGNFGQVLSFSATKDDESDETFSSGVANLNSGLFSPLQNFILGFIVAIILLSLVLMRERVWKLLLKVRTINLF